MTIQKEDGCVIYYNFLFCDYFNGRCGISSVAESLGKTFKIFFSRYKNTVYCWGLCMLEHQYWVREEFKVCTISGYLEQIETDVFIGRLDSEIPSELVC